MERLPWKSEQPSCTCIPKGFVNLKHHTEVAFRRLDRDAVLHRRGNKFKHNTVAVCVVRRGKS